MEKRPKVYCFDLDQTLCDTVEKKYFDSWPLKDRIEIVNKLYDEGNIIKIYTARGMPENNGDITLVYSNNYERVKKQIDCFGIKYHQLILGKPRYDVFVDDKAYNSEDFFHKEPKRITGFIAGAFDVIHPGYIKMFRECKKHCNYLIVAIHDTPELERGKRKPILSLEDRCNIVGSIRFVDGFYTYRTEERMLNIIKESPIPIDKIFLGDDYKTKYRNVDQLNIPIHYIDRSHNWSVTKFKTLIYEQIKKEKE